MFDLLQNEIIEIGENVKLKMWKSLSSEKQQEEILNDNTKNYYIANILPNKTPIIIYQPITQDRNEMFLPSSYTINLNTLEPTKKSPIQTKIPKHIKNKYLEMYNNFSYISMDKENMHTHDIPMDTYYIPMDTKFACFDTETTGISKEDVVIQFAIGFYDNNGILLKYHCNLWNLPEDIPINKRAYETHKIDRERINKEGVNTQEELLLFQNMCKELKKRNLKIIAHNSSFDYRLIKQTALRYNIDFILEKDDFFCTMINSKYILKLKNKIGHIKNPSNKELYMYLMNQEPTEDLHDAFEDVKVTAKSYFAGLQQKIW